jgi:acetylornithine deacetylase/succinyl-diaminopimelate desuccinylase-like protein
LRVDSSSGRITIPALNPKSKPLGIPYRRAFRIAARLEPAPASHTLKELIAQNIARKILPHDIFNRLHGLATTRPGYAFTYSDPLDAASFLIEKFKGRSA